MAPWSTTQSIDSAPRSVTLNQALSAKRILGLDFVRAIAVLLVLLDHSNIGSIGPVLIDGGFGVEMFFVLSGFLITRQLLQDLDKHNFISLGYFYRRRAARLLPAFYAYLIIGLVPLLVLHRYVPWGAVVSSATYVINYYQAFTGAQTHYLSHCWSLAVEEQFYILWPVLLIFAVHRRWSVGWTLVGVLASVWVVRGIMVANGATEEYLYRALETRADQLAVGCLLAVLVTSTRATNLLEKLARPWVAILIIGSILLSLSYFRGTIPFKYLAGYTFEPLAVGALIPMIVLAASRGTVVSRILNFGPMVTIGRISYGMYLFHPYLLQPIRHLFLRFTTLPGVATTLSIFGVALVAWLSFTFFEDPLRKFFTRPPAAGAPATA